MPTIYRPYRRLRRVARRFVPSKAAGGGTTFTTNPTGSTTPAGSLTKLVLKALAGSETPTGALNKQANKALAGSSTAAGSLTKVAAKSLAGSSTGTGALTKQAGKNAAGSSTGSGSLGKSCAKPLAGSSTAAGSLAKKANKSLAGSSTASGTFSAIKVALKSVAGSLTAAGSLVRSTAKSLAGSVAAAGSLAKSSTRHNAGSVTPSGALAKQANKPLAGTLLRGSKPPAAIAVWRFDSTTKDATGNGHDLSRPGTTAFAAGKFGQAATFTTPDLMSTAGAVGSQATAGPWSLSLWLFNASGVPTGDVFLQDDAGDGGVSGYRFGTGENHAIVQQVAGVSVAEVFGSPDLLVGSWNHIAVTTDGATLTLWVNGVSKGTADCSAATGFLSQGLFVAQFDGATYIDDLAFVPAALSSSDIAYIWNGGAGLTYPSGRRVTLTPMKALAGAVTGAGGLIRKAFKALAGLVTGAGALATSGGAAAATTRAVRATLATPARVSATAAISPRVGGTVATPASLDAIAAATVEA